jgi:hypothetical protein
MSFHAVDVFWLGIVPVIRYGCVTLGFLTLVALCWAIRDYRRLNRWMEELRTAWSEQTGFTAGSVLGQEPANLEAARQKAAGRSAVPRDWWQTVDEHVQHYESSSGEDRVFLGEPARVVLPYGSVVGRHFNANFYSIIPGLLTGAGLTLTFVAILTALYHVHYDKGNSVEPVSGMPDLINGLSGKFLSSIVALVLSILFTFVERALVRWLRQDYERLVSSLNRFLPTLSSKRLLLDIGDSARKAATSAANISAEVTDRLVAAVNEHVLPVLSADLARGLAGALQQELNPTMTRMTGSLASLEGAIVNLEAQKEQSVTGQFEKITERLEASLTAALGKMASGFQDALSGSAREEFGNMQGAMAGTRESLAEVNRQFRDMQETFQRVVSQAEATTAGQLRSGREQTEALGMVMQSLMSKLEESTQNGLATMQSQLGGIVEHMTAKIGALSAEMMANAQLVTTNSEHSSAEFLRKAEASSAATAAQMQALLTSMADRSKEFQLAGTTLREAQGQVKMAITESAGALNRMREAGREINTFTQQLVTQTGTMRDAGEANRKTAETLTEAAGVLRAASERQQHELARYQEKIDGFGKVMNGLDENIAGIMRASTEGLRDYNAKVQQNFQAIVDSASKLVPQIAQLLQGQVEQLSETLEDLSETLTKAKSNGRG